MTLSGSIPNFTRWNIGSSGRIESNCLKPSLISTTTKRPSTLAYSPTTRSPIQMAPEAGPPNREEAEGSVLVVPIH